MKESSRAISQRAVVDLPNPEPMNACSCFGRCLSIGIHWCRLIRGFTLRGYGAGFFAGGVE